MHYIEKQTIWVTTLERHSCKVNSVSNKVCLLEAKAHGLLLCSLGLFWQLLSLWLAISSADGVLHNLRRQNCRRCCRRSQLSRLCLSLWESLMGNAPLFDG
ncbi:hypothetical protein LY76DRAFT_38551 [Colletotrichum caudatum]|nr:hypothetical protein LY76DRAFT_38551 [Colletotrichum caudatum]